MTPGGLGSWGEGLQILDVNVYRVAPPPGEGGYYRYLHLQFWTPFPHFPVQRGVFNYKQ